MGRKMQRQSTLFKGKMDTKRDLYSPAIIRLCSESKVYNFENEHFAFTEDGFYYFPLFFSFFFLFLFLLEATKKKKKEKKKLSDKSFTFY